MNVNINGTNFELHSYFVTENGLSVRLTNATIDAIETAVADEATVQIGEEYKGYDLALVSIAKEYETDTLRVVFHRATLDKLVAKNTEDIETANDAIAELAEIIGG